eukprot:737842-Amphidinium_carterae.2
MTGVEKLLGDVRQVLVSETIGGHSTPEVSSRNRMNQHTSLQSLYWKAMYYKVIYKRTNESLLPLCLMLRSSPEYWWCITNCKFKLRRHVACSTCAKIDAGAIGIGSMHAGADAVGMLSTERVWMLCT